MLEIDEVITRANESERSHRWEEASKLFLVLAHHYKDAKRFDQAADFFMRAAVARERCEDWRLLGQVWSQCGSSLESRATGPVTDLYDSMEASQHFFPTLDFFAWERFSHDARVGRAFRNAAYHLEKAGSNQSAYIQYRRSGDAFERGGMLAEASRSYYHALLSFIERNGELDPDILHSLEKVNAALIAEDDKKYLKRAQLYYRGLGGKLISKGNYDDATRLFTREAEVSMRLAKTQGHFLKWIGFGIWKYSSWYGNSFWLWTAWIVILFFVTFPILFHSTGVLVWRVQSYSPTWLDYVYFSLANATTGADPSFDLTRLGKALVMLEWFAGLLLFGSLVTLLAKKTLR